ncbi:RNA methyltransferase [Clostridium sp. 19966]|uniref:TrmH family RNA methyltransferase n=1 Tax=Clostridium sp. 19966 TaxID=2768166 RepID=UPI0028DF23A7|nr:RNA methyltransferase [Clostridium sp. 19966]MDT8716525.1 RNA methyltransferase [Clostridium sp. 19966]
MNTITSKDNHLFKDAKKLKERKYREEKGKFIIEGIRFVEEAVNANASIDKIFVSSSFSQKNKIFKWNDYDTYELKDVLFKELCSTENPQGIAAVVNAKNEAISSGDGIYVLVDKLQDPGNMGTIIRTAHAVNASGVIYTAGTVDPYNDKTLRSTMGSIFYIPVMKDEKFEFLSKLKRDGYLLVVSALDAQEDFYELDYTSKTIIAVGNEGNGISDEVLSKADVKVKIPMPGGAESLNASVAASVMLYEVLRQNVKKA